MFKINRKGQIKENNLSFSLTAYDFFKHCEMAKWFSREWTLFPTFALAELFSHNAGARSARARVIF
jgi:hypothetical protein